MFKDRNQPKVTPKNEPEPRPSDNIATIAADTTRTKTGIAMHRSSVEKTLFDAITDDEAGKDFYGTSVECDMTKEERDQDVELLKKISRIKGESFVKTLFLGKSSVPFECGCVLLENQVCRAGALI